MTLLPSIFAGAGAISPSATSARVDSTIPPQRQRLLEVNRRLEEAERRLEVLKQGRQKLLDLNRVVQAAREELDSLVQADARSLADRIRSGVDFCISRAITHRAHSLNAKLADSALESEVGLQALSQIDADIAEAQRALSEHRAAKEAALSACLDEIAQSYSGELAVILDDLRQVICVLSGLDALAPSDGSWAKASRPVAVIPSVNGLPERAVVAPSSAVMKAKAAWLAFRNRLAKDPLASVDDLKFDHVTGHEDNGRVNYETLHPVERKLVDLSNAAGIGVN